MTDKEKNGQEELVKDIKDKAVEAEEPAVAEDKAAQSKDPTVELNAKIEDLEAQVAKLKNAYAMAYADTENTKKRLSKEYEQHMRYHIQSFAKDVLPVLDNCERALNIKAEDARDENYRKAFEMVLKQLKSSLLKEGVEEIDALGKEFDADCMQALMVEHVEGTEPNMVLEVMQKGYKLKDRLLRAAMVKVSE